MLGPLIDLFWPFFLVALGVTFIVWAILNFVVGKFTYSGPEDDEEWDEDNHFTVKSDVEQ
jgi:hypothetical protein